MDGEMLDLNERLEKQRQLAEEADRKVEDLKDELLQKNAEYEQRERAKEKAEKEKR